MTSSSALAAVGKGCHDVCVPTSSLLQYFWLTHLLLDLVLEALKEDHHDVQDALVHVMSLVPLPLGVLCHLVCQGVHVGLLDQVVLKDTYGEASTVQALCVQQWDSIWKTYSCSLNTRSREEQKKITFTKFEEQKLSLFYRYRFRYVYSTTVQKKVLINIFFLYSLQLFNRNNKDRLVVLKYVQDLYAHLVEVE